MNTEYLLLKFVSVSKCRTLHHLKILTNTGLLQLQNDVLNIPGNFLKQECCNFHYFILFDLKDFFFFFFRKCTLFHSEEFMDTLQHFLNFFILIFIKTLLSVFRYALYTSILIIKKNDTFHVKWVYAVVNLSSLICPTSRSISL